MKKIIWTSCVVILVSTVLFYSCSKSIKGRTEDIDALQPGNNDADAGSWKTCLLAAPDEVSVNAPAATTTPDYIAQINEIKGWQKNMSEADKKCGILECRRHSQVERNITGTGCKKKPAAISECRRNLSFP